LLRTDPIEFDVTRPVLCPEAQKFAQWIDTTLDEEIKEPTHQSLDTALLHLTKEYLYRTSRVNHTHQGYACLHVVFEEKANALFERQMSLIRKEGYTQVVSPSQPSTPSEEPKQELFIGEEIDEDW